VSGKFCKSLRWAEKGKKIGGLSTLKTSWLCVPPRGEVIFRSSTEKVLYSKSEMVEGKKKSGEQNAKHKGTGRNNDRCRKSVRRRAQGKLELMQQQRQGQQKLLFDKRLLKLRRRRRGKGKQKGGEMGKKSKKGILGRD